MAEYKFVVCHKLRVVVTSFLIQGTLCDVDNLYEVDNSNMKNTVFNKWLSWQLYL